MEKKRLTTEEWLAFKESHPSELHNKLEDIIISVSWREFAHRYMNRKAPWLYDKINGFNQYGEPVPPMTEEELSKFKNGLLNLSERIKRVAESL